MTYENNAVELGLERLVDFSLPTTRASRSARCKKIKAQGVSRRLVGVELDGRSVPGAQQRQVAGVSRGGRGVESAR
jgi:hypothetical protein